MLLFGCECVTKTIARELQSRGLEEGWHLRGKGIYQLTP